MTGTAATAAFGPALTKLGLASGQIVQEFGYDSDVEDEFRIAVEQWVGSDLEDESYGDVADVAMLWFRDDEQDDLVDLIVDAMTSLADDGFIVLLTPRAGRAGQVLPSDVAEAASTAGLTLGGNVNACADWTAARLMAPKSNRR